MKRYLGLLWKRFALSLAEGMHDRLDFTMDALTQLGVMALNIIFFSVIYQHVPALGGWSYEQALLILGLYQLLDGACNFVLRNNVRHISKYVRLGQFDQVLLQPVDPQVNLLRRFRISQIGVMLSSLLLLGYAAQILGLGLWQTVGITTLSFGIGFMLHWSVMFGIGTIGFWMIKSDHITHLAQVILEIGRLPTTALGPKVGQFFTFVIPLAIVATIPAQLVFGQPVWPLAVMAGIVVLILFILSREFFFWALKSYSSVSG